MGERGQIGLLLTSICTDIFVGSSWCGVRRGQFDICNTWFMDSLINLTDLGGSPVSLLHDSKGKFRHPTETTWLAVKATSGNKLKRISSCFFLVVLFSLFYFNYVYFNGSRHSTKDNKMRSFGNLQAFFRSTKKQILYCQKIAETNYISKRR